MSNPPPRSQLLKVAAVARRTGVSVRTLHYYEELGLLRPSRQAGSGHRVYSLDDIQRLQQIRSLQQLGMSLSDIAECLEQRRIDARGVVAEHLERVREQRASLKSLELQLQRLASFLASGARDGEQPLDVFLSTLETIIMFDKYFTKEQLSRLADHQAHDQNIVTPTVAALEQARTRGVASDSDEARTLLARFHEAIEDVAGGDVSMVDAIKKLLHQEREARERHGISEELFAYMAEIAGGIEHRVAT